jgi:hypothetical protein
MLFRVLSAVLLLAGCSHAVFAQNASPYRQIITAKNIAVADTIAGQNLDLNLINPLAQHGNVSLIIIAPGGGGNPYVYQVLYTPDPGYVGTDTFALEYNYGGSYPFLTYRGFRVSVYPSVLTPNADFATTVSGAPVTIDVVANDVVSNGPLTVTEIPGSTHGSATIAGNQVVFTPEPGYTGIGHFNYTVCDATGYCKTSSVNIGIHPASAPVNDTTQVFTAKNTVLYYPLLYSGYSLFQAPVNGSLLVNSGQSFRYVPNFNYTGEDVFSLVNNDYGAPVYKTVKIATLNTPTQNLMAIEDFAYTPKNKAVTFNVRQNDIGNLTVKGWIIPNNLPGTVSGTNGIGNVTFTPDNNYAGVATFYYKLGNSNVPDLEIGTVNVIVGNLPPSAGLFDLTTPKETPLVINYKIPFIGFNFTVTDPPNHGACAFYPGLTTQTFGSQSVTGNNLLVYTPAPGYVGSDEFEINYCIPSNGNCQTVKIAVNISQVVSASAPYCIGDACVWAGDANNDGIVNNKDLLPIGYFMGMDGAVRNGASLEWFGQYGTNWNNPFPGAPIDLKYADTDGSGQVTSEDTLALGYFYGQTHKLTPNIPPTSKGLPFFLNFLTPPNPQVGDLVEVEVSLGNAAGPVTNLNGFTFDISLSPLLVDSAFHMEYYPNTWINTNAPYLDLSKRPRVGRLETAFTRTNGVAASGYGVIGKFDFIIIDVIIGARPSLGAAPNLGSFMTIQGNLMSADGTYSVPFEQTLEFPVRSREDGTVAIAATNSEDLRVYPSPASQQLQVHLNGSDLMESLKITDLTGRVIWQSGNLQAEHTQVDLSTFANGTYIAVARTQNGQVARKFQVAK